MKRKTVGFETTVRGQRLRADITAPAERATWARALLGKLMDVSAAYEAKESALPAQMTPPPAPQLPGDALGALRAAEAFAEELAAAASRDPRLTVAYHRARNAARLAGDFDVAAARAELARDVVPGIAEITGSGVHVRLSTPENQPTLLQELATTAEHAVDAPHPVDFYVAAARALQLADQVRAASGGHVPSGQAPSGQAAGEHLVPQLEQLLHHVAVVAAFAAEYELTMDLAALALQLASDGRDADAAEAVSRVGALLPRDLTPVAALAGRVNETWLHTLTDSLNSLPGRRFVLVKAKDPESPESAGHLHPMDLGPTITAATLREVSTLSDCCLFKAGV